MQISHLGEVIFYAEDMDGLVRFYRDVLGLIVTHPVGRSDFSGEFWVTFDTGPCTLALHGGGERRVSEDSPKIVFFTPDLAASRATLVSRGLDISSIRSPAPGVQVCDACDPEGNRFSLEARS